MASDAKSRLKEIIDSYLERDGGGGIDTGIVASHLAQMTRERVTPHSSLPR